MNSPFVCTQKTYANLCHRSADCNQEGLMRARILTAVKTDMYGLPRSESPDQKCLSNVGQNTYRLEQFPRRSNVRSPELTRNLSHRASSN